MIISEYLPASLKILKWRDHLHSEIIIREHVVLILSEKYIFLRGRTFGPHTDRHFFILKHLLKGAFLDRFNT